VNAALLICATLGIAAPVEDEEPETVAPAPAPTTAPTPAPSTTATPPTSPSPPGREYDGVEHVEAAPALEPTPVEPATITTMDPAVAAELAALRARVESLESERKPAPRELGALRDRGGDLPFTSIGFGRSLGADRWGIRFSGYIQAQYQSNQLSEDQLQQGGQPLNRDRFMIRRGRARGARACD
jgi:hypothetical protein